MRLTVTALALAVCACGGSTPEGGWTEGEPPEWADEARADGGLGIIANNAFFYYADVEAADDFYTRVLGVRKVADYGFAKILQIAESSFLTLVDAEMGMHSADEPKTVALALITDQLDEWWRYLMLEAVPMRSDSYAPDLESAHDGFVAIDPEGYLLEFERFNEHPENEKFCLLYTSDAADD